MAHTVTHPSPQRHARFDAPTASLATRVGVFAYGVACYAAFFGTFLYAIGFLGNVLVPKGIDAPREGPLWAALLINLGLLGLFAVQHSVMARPAFKRWWTQFVPEPAERSTYVIASSVALWLLFWLWRPIGGVIWEVTHPVAVGTLYALFAVGFLIVLIATFQINHFDLFGLRHVWLFLRRKRYSPLVFKTPVMYRVVRHPLYVGWIIAFWATPRMTAAHLVFAIATTLYMLIAIQFEERDLVAAHGDDYADYRSRVPMIVPGWRKRVRPQTQAVTA